MATSRAAGGMTCSSVVRERTTLRAAADRLAVVEVQVQGQVSVRQAAGKGLVVEPGVEQAGEVVPGLPLGELHERVGVDGPVGVLRGPARSRCEERVVARACSRSACRVSAPRL